MSLTDNCSVADEGSRSVLEAIPLRGVRVALSVSEPADVGADGRAELTDAIGSIVQQIVADGGTVVFCPRLPLSDLSRVVIERATPVDDDHLSLLLVVPEIEYSRYSVKYLRELKKSLQPTGALVLVTSSGERATLDHTLTSSADAVAPSHALAALRDFVAKSTDARIALGGKLGDRPEDEPGIVQECRLSLAAGGIVLPLGGFGGAAGAVDHLIRSRELMPRTVETSSSNDAQPWADQVRQLSATSHVVLASEPALASSRDPNELAVAACRGLRLLLSRL